MQLFADSKKQQKVRSFVPLSELLFSSHYYNIYILEEILVFLIIIIIIISRMENLVLSLQAVVIFGTLFTNPLSPNIAGE